jgi:hypothetical protein
MDSPWIRRSDTVTAESTTAFIAWQPRQAMVDQFEGKHFTVRTTLSKSDGAVYFTDPVGIIKDPNREPLYSGFFLIKDER